MLQKGQIRFINEAVQVVEKIFQVNKVEKFLAISAKGAVKPPGFSEFYERLLGEKQDPNSNYQVYTNDWQKTDKLFNEVLISQGKLGLIMSPSYSCVLYITDSQKSQYNYLKISSHNWPAVFLDEQNSQSISKYEFLFRNKSVDLSELLLNLNKK